MPSFYTATMRTRCYERTNSRISLAPCSSLLCFADAAFPSCGQALYRTPQQPLAGAMPASIVQVCILNKKTKPLLRCKRARRVPWQRLHTTANGSVYTQLQIAASTQNCKLRTQELKLFNFHTCCCCWHDLCSALLRIAVNHSLYYCAGMLI